MCHRQLAQLREKIATREDELGAQLIAVDPHELWSARYLLKEVGLSTQDVNYPLLADAAQVVSATYGVAFQMRVHTEVSNRPATFIIDNQGVLRYARRGRTFGDRPTAEQIVAELEKIDR